MKTDTILLVEDSEDDIFFFLHTAKKSRITNPVQVVKDGQEAIDYLKGDGRFSDRTQYPLPSLILLDLNLPLRQGLSILRWIREQPAFELIIVLVLTSSSSEKDIHEAYQLGANSYLLKPSDPPRLGDLLNLINDYWLSANQLPPGGLAPF